MTDTMTAEQRHYCMSQIRGKNTSPEIIVRKYLHSKGFRYSLHSKHLPGSPDITLAKYHTVIFVNGCFWHGHPGCRHTRPPKTRKAYWSEKIRRNKERDAAVVGLLEEAGWCVLIVWECSLKKSFRDATLSELERRLRQRLEPEHISRIPPSVRKMANAEEG